MCEQIQCRIAFLEAISRKVSLYLTTHVDIYMKQYFESKYDNYLYSRETILNIPY